MLPYYFFVKYKFLRGSWTSTVLFFFQYGLLVRPLVVWSDFPLKRKESVNQFVYQLHGVFKKVKIFKRYESATFWSSFGSAFI